MLLEDDVNSQIPASVRHYCYVKARPTWFLLLELGGSKFLHSKKKKICKFNHESCMSVVFRDESGKVNTEDNKHRCQV